MESWLDTAVAREAPLRLLRVQGSADAWLISRLRDEHPGPILVIAPSSKRAERMAGDLKAFSTDADTSPSTDGVGEIGVLPRYDVPPFDRFSPHPELEARRMSLLYRLLSANDQTALTVVAPWSALLRRVLPRAELRGRVTHLEAGMNVDRDALLQVLVSAGYHHTKLVEERGEVAARGGVIDIFPPQLEQPARIEFDFDAIASMRQFDPQTQRSSGALRHLTAIPPRAYRIPDDLDGLLQRTRDMGRDMNVPESNIYAVNESLARRHFPPGIESLEPLFHDGLETVFDYLPASSLVVIDDPEAGRARAITCTEEIFAGHAQARHEDRLVCDPLSMYMSDDTAWAEALSRNPVIIDSLGAGSGEAEQSLAIDAIDHSELRREIAARQGSGHALEPLVQRLASWRSEARRVRLTCPSLSAAERLADILRDYGEDLEISSKGMRSVAEALPEPGSCDIVVAPLASGFDLPSEGLVVLTEQDIFGERSPRRVVRSTRRGLPVERLAQIAEGDFLVHAEHGIGRYSGLVQLDLRGFAQEFVLVEFAKGDKLYLPVYRLGQIQRYSGADGHAPRLDRLGNQIWSRTKSRVLRAVRDMAEELLAVVAARQVMQGHQYPPPDADYEEFEARFPYEDTPDQRRATEDVLADLQSERPMDRLVCGDVGFGKTEVACRAAHVTTASGRQVAFLVPTTVLCQQHYKTLCDRFADTPVEVASLSRLSSPRQARETLEGLASGRIDLVVGTHRLLSKDVHFRNLGLLISDEEHRFGVTHKERIKQMRKLVDVLTLTATPIPRTLQMSLTGMRDLSLIATPPPDRQAVRTQICRFADEVIQDAIQRELRRGGQCFFVHNRVETISEMAGYVSRLVPEAKIAIAHGQMSGHQLEEIMLGFVDRDYDVLVCTAIIESGLDISNANTILINRADHFGLAQLHQLRGRVGRSDRRAYAYLLLPAEGHMSEDARRRIEAISDLSELGSGFRLATEDLEIRGAGNLLGAEQSGHIASVGYDLYMEMLEQAIAELRGEDLESGVEPEIRLPIPALMPEAYVRDVNQRLVIYKQLSSTRDENELRDVVDDVLDRFGPLPEESKNLVEVIRLKIRCKKLGIESVDTSGGELVLQLGERASVDPKLLLRLLQQPDTPLRITPDQRIYLRLRSAEDALAEAFGLVELMGGGE